jgi:hypothetical protein
MRAARYIHDRRVLIAWFCAGVAIVLFAYFLWFAGPSKTPLSLAQRSAASHGVRHNHHLNHISLSCGKNSSSRSAQTVCAGKGSMYASLVALHTPRAEILYMLVHDTSTETLNGVPVPEAKHLHDFYGVPMPLARKLAPHVLQVIQNALTASNSAP